MTDQLVEMTDQEAIEVAKGIKLNFDPKARPEVHQALDRLIALAERRLYGS